MNATTSNTARIAVVDDHGIVCFGYAQLIGQAPGLEICGIAASEQAGYALLRQEQPDLAIVDLSLKQGDGMDLIESVSKHLPRIKLLVISAHDENLFAHRVLAAGAHGYINKQEAPDRLIDAIETLLAGEFCFSEAVMNTIVRNRLGRPKQGNLVGIETLTNREIQVFELIGNGQSTRQIAIALNLSIKTIERYKENIKQKLGIENATQLVQHATQWVLKRGY